MTSYRITKYNPVYRKSSGAYANDEWTSYSDIGNFFSQKRLSFAEYLSVEDAYVSAVVMLAECGGVSSFKVKYLDKLQKAVDENLNGEMLDVYNNILNDDVIGLRLVKCVCRLILRNYLWAELASIPMRVGFGYDYYMYVKLLNACGDELKQIKRAGLFVEEHEYIYNDSFMFDSSELLRNGIHHTEIKYIQSFDKISSLQLIQLCDDSDVGIMSVDGMVIGGYIDDDKDRPFYDTPSSADFSELYNSSTEEEFSQKSVEAARKFFEQETDSQLSYEFRLVAGPKCPYL